MWQLKAVNMPFLRCSYSGLGGQREKTASLFRNVSTHCSSEKCGMSHKGAILVHEHPHCITTIAAPGDACSGNATRLIIVLRISVV